MITAKGVCGRCGAKISGDTPQELCPACLLQAGLSQLQDESEAAVVGSGPDDGLHESKKSPRDPKKSSATLATTNYWRKSAAAARA
jgi:hypothetical protein